MARRNRDRVEHDAPPTPRRSWSARIAWAVLVVGAVVIATRLSLATVVQIHGDGMAPTLLDGDHVLLLRQGWGIERGDVVVYDPTPAAALPPDRGLPGPGDAPNAPDADGDEYPDVRRDPNADLRNTAVVDREELERNFERVQQKSGGVAASFEPTPLRLGRVIALPGDTITFHVRGAALGLAINGEPLEQKPSDPVRIALKAKATPQSPGPTGLYPIAYETTGKRRYRVLAKTTRRTPTWAPLALPDPATPVEVRADGYLILADNRDEGACCDSRAIGWITPPQVRGRVLIRLAGDPTATPDHAPSSRGFLWKP